MAPLPAPAQGHPLSVPRGEGPGLYVHVPFCRARCPYCDFATAPYTARGAARWVEAVLAEAGAVAAEVAGARFETVFLGGGTPSLLEPVDFLGLIDGLRQRLDIQPGAEFTVEANPEDADRLRLAAWRQGGVTRVSLGIQSLGDGELARLGRRHGAEGARRAALAVAGSFDDWSLDLLYGFPGHGEAAWRRTLERALALSPPHVSAYHFTPETGTPTGDAVRAGRVRVPHEGEAAALFETTAAVLGAAGYRHYEVSNFARPGRESRHNLLYWRRRPYLGLGPAAVSFWAERRRRNERDAAEYAARALAGRDCVEESEDAAPRAELETFLLGLRLDEGVAWSDVERLGTRAGAWREAARRLAAAGWLEADAERVRVGSERRRLTDEMVLRLWGEAEPSATRVDSAGGGPVQ